MKNIVHLTPHLGGGVGSVLRAYFAESKSENEFNHSLMSLDTLDPYSKEFLNDLGIDWIEGCYQDTLDNPVNLNLADVIIIHWWNHPLLQSLIYNCFWPNSRIIYWIHISGNMAPNCLNYQSLKLADKIIFTSPLSGDLTYIKKMLNQLNQEFKYIWSTSGIEKYLRLESKKNALNKNKKLHIGYVGNLDPVKLSPDFFEIMKEILLLDENIDIEIIGPPTDYFLKEISKISDKRLKYLGKISEELKMEKLNEFTLFAYPLSKNHYGTCDQALQEAMSSGCAIVVLNNPMERGMVGNGKAGVIANNKSEFVKSISKFLRSEETLKEYALEARSFAKQEYSLKIMTDKWKIEINNILLEEKSKKQSLRERIGREITPAEVFAESVRGFHDEFIKYLTTKSVDEKNRLIEIIRQLGQYNQWQSPTKSSVHHFLKFFNDSNLMIWSQQIQNFTSLQIKKNIELNDFR